MAVFPKCDLLNLPIKLCCLVGIFPSELLFEANKSFKMLYRLFSAIYFAGYVWFTIATPLRLYYTVKEDGFDLGAVAENVAVIFPMVTGFCRVVMIRLRPGFSKIIKYIIDNEKFLDYENDQELKKIYNETVLDLNGKIKGYVGTIITFVSIFFLLPSIPILKDVFKSPRYAWSPFDEDAYPVATWFYQFAYDINSTSTIVITDILLYSMIVYPIGQLRLLKHRLRNFEKYLSKAKFVNNLTDENEAAYRNFVEIIEVHKKIIGYVDLFNDSLGIMMAFEFVQSSLQLAAWCSQALGDMKLQRIIFCIAGYSGFLIRLTLCYFPADRVMHLSEDLAACAWGNEWYKRNAEIKYMTLTFMMRAQKALKMNIGPFGHMSLEYFVLILRTTYSYIMLVYSLK